MVFTDQPDLVETAQDAAERLRDLEQPIRIVAHYDCDGISSAVIAHEALNRAGKAFDITFVEELNEQVLREIKATTDEDVFLFIDIGSGQIEDIADILENKEVIIGDHHEPGDADVDYHVNPHLVGIDGGEDISGAGVTYLIMRLMASMNSENSLDRTNSESSLSEENKDLLTYALVGATGDIQKDGGTYLGLNHGMMQEAEEEGLIERKKGLRLYGRSTKSIVDSLQYTTDPFLPGISNDPSGAVQFLSEIGIEMRNNGDWRTLEDLSIEEEKEIVHGLITRGYDVGDLIGNVYIMENGWEIGEFSSLMNACGRIGRPEAGITICLEDDYELAQKIKRTYGRKIGKYLSFVENNQEDSQVVKRFENGAIIVADDNIHANMIGTITTICQKSDIVPGSVLVGLAEKGEEHVKISARATNGFISEELTMNKLMSEICANCDGEGGGHDAAAGGKIPRSEADRFIKMTGEVLKEGSLDPVIGDSGSKIQ